MNIIQEEYESFFQVYKRLPIIVDRAEGVRIYDIDGVSFLDMLGGIAVNVLGHSHPALISAIEIQAKKYLHISNYFYQAPQVELAKALKELSGGMRVFFSNSGAEAIEGAIKLARKFGTNNGKKNIVAFSGGFHGRTYGSLSIMDKPHYKQGMGPFLDDVTIAKYNDINSLQESIDSDTSAVFLEFIQGEGGLASPSKEFISELFRLKEKNNFLVVADEVQAGCGRTGKFFSFEHWDAKPDIICLAKGIGGGLPLGAILAKSELAELFSRGEHGTTFGGNPLSCACGIAVLNELKGGVMENAQKSGEYFKNKIDELINDFPKLVLENRGIGLMRGILLSFPAKNAVSLLLENKIIANAAGDYVLRLLPPLVLTSAEIDEFIMAFREILTDKRIYD